LIGSLIEADQRLVEARRRDRYEEVLPG